MSLLPWSPLRLATDAMSRTRRWAWSMGLLAVALYLFYALVLPTRAFPIQARVDMWTPLTSVNESLIWVVLAVGFHIILRRAATVDLAFPVYWAIGGYGAGWLMSAFWRSLDLHLFSAAPQRQPGLHISFWLVMAIAGVGAALLARGIASLAGDAPAAVVAVTTMMLWLISWQIMRIGGDIWGLNITNGSRGIQPIDPLGFAGVRIGPYDLTERYLIYVAIAGTAIALSLRLGTAGGAVRTAHMWGACVGGVGGVAYATHAGAVSPSHFDVSAFVALVAIVVIGAPWDVWGLIFAAMGITWVRVVGWPLLSELTGRELSGVLTILLAAVVVVILLVRRGRWAPV